MSNGNAAPHGFNSRSNNPSSPCDRILPSSLDEGFTRKLIRRKAKRMSSQAGFTSSDAEDIEQELWLKMIKTLQSFDPARANWPAFVAVVVDRCAANLVRHRRAEKRDPVGVCSLSAVVRCGDGRDIELSAAIGQREFDALRGHSARSQQEHADLVSDVSELMHRLSPKLQDLCDRLKRDSIAQVARDLGVPRTTLSSRITKLRRRFERSDLKKYL